MQAAVVHRFAAPLSGEASSVPAPGSERVPDPRPPGAPRRNDDVAPAGAAAR